MHPRLLSLFVLISLLITGAANQVAAQGQDLVVVKKTNFDSKEGAYDDYLFEVELEAMAPGEDPIDPKYLDNVGVEVLIGYPHPNKQGEFLFHRASVTIATMEIRQSRSIGFWMPYDVAQRDKMAKEPEFWMITLSVDGAEIPISKSNSRNRLSSNLTNKAAIDKMMSLASDATEGVFLPGYLSGNGYLERGRERPPFVRIEEN